MCLRPLALCLIATLLPLAACGADALPSITPAPPTSAWGQIITIGQAEQTGGPAFALAAGEAFFAWIGADETGVHQDMRLLNTEGALAERAVLPLPPIHPFDQSVYPAAGGAHLLWLDADPQEPAGGLRLFSALVNWQLQGERGPVRLSDRQTLRYAALPNRDGSLWVVWSGGPLAEPNLYAQPVSPSGIPQSPQHLIGDADWPALVRTNAGQAFLYWQTGTQIYRAGLGDGALEGVQPITEAPRLAPGDRLESFRAALDQTHGYLFWDLTRADGSAEVWFASGPLEAASWARPARLGISILDQPQMTGFNTGTARAAASGDVWLRWASPASGQFVTLPLAAQVGDALSLIVFQAGAARAYQAVAPLDFPLIGPPHLLADRALHLHLSWAQPTGQATADLRFTSTRR